jgi:hypothetical protein
LGEDLRRSGVAIYPFCLIAMELTGPCVYRAGVFKNLKQFQILDASFEHDGNVTPLPENTFCVEHMGSTLFVYHGFRFIDEDSHICNSEWGNKNMPLDTFKGMKKNLFRHVHDGAIFRIFFSEKVAEELRNFVT